MRTRHTYLLFIINLIFLTLAHSQNKEIKDTPKFRVGLSLGAIQNDLSVGLEMSIPIISFSNNEKGFSLNLKNSLAVNNSIIINAEIGTKDVTHPYYLGNYQWIYYHKINGLINLYSGAGFLLLTGNNELINKNISTGGVGFFGFEFNNDYFFEFGVAGNKNRNLYNQVFSNGLYVAVGFRI